MLEQRVVKARSEINDRCLRFGYHLDGDRVQWNERLDSEIKRLGVTHPLARAAHRLKHCDQRLSHATPVE